VFLAAFIGAAGPWLCLGSSDVASAGTLEKVRARGHVVCGVSNGVKGFAAPDANGRWAGFDVDFCRALAAAIFLDDSKTKFRPLDAGEGVTALRQGEIDILARPSDQTLELQTAGGVEFVAVSFFDGQILLVRKSMGIDSALQLSGARICFVDQPRLRAGLSMYFGLRKMPVELKTFARPAEAAAAYEQRECDALTEDLSRLPALLADLRIPADNMRLPPVLAVHPLGPLVREGDETWHTITQWTLFVMLGAEEAGLDHSEVAHPAGERSAAARLLLVESDLGPKLGLPPGWGEAIIAKVGNYGEVFERNLGARGPAGLERGLNNLWSAGGLMVAPRLR